MGYELDRIHPVHQDLCARDGNCHADLDIVHGICEAQGAGSMEWRFFG